MTALPADAQRLSRQFHRFGWIGFWIQISLLALSLCFVIFYLASSGSPEAAQRRGIDFSPYLSLGSLVIMLFTTLWCFRYTRLARRIASVERRPAWSSVTRILWIGVWASAFGVLWSMVMTTNASLRMLFVLLATPQTGVPVVSPMGDPTRTVSALDALALTALQLTLAAELVVLAVSLWLLSRVTRSLASAPG